LNPQPHFFKPVPFQFEVAAPDFAFSLLSITVVALTAYQHVFPAVILSPGVSAASNINARSATANESDQNRYTQKGSWDWKEKARWTALGVDCIGGQS